MSEPHFSPLIEVGQSLARKRVSPVELTEAMLRRIAALEGTLHGYACVMADSARGQAKRAEQEIMRGQLRGPLHGVPVAVKDLCFTRGVPTGCGMTIFADRKPDFSATVVERFEQAGAVILGKLRMTEGAFAQHHPRLPAALNPWRIDHWAGASSSGSGVATAAGLCFASLGSDTGGSIRFPSAANGVTGLKPTWGRVSRHGVFPLAESMDHIGPMARSAADAAAVLGVIAGADDNDPTALRAPVPDYLHRLGTDLRGLRIGLDADHVGKGVDDAVAKAVEAAVATLRRLGADVRAVTMPPLRELLEGWMGHCGVETAIAHAATYPARASEYGPVLSGLIEFGRNLSGMDLARIQLARQAFRGRLAVLFEDVDMIVCPAMYRTVPTLSDMATLGSDPEDIVNLLRFTAPYNFSGNPTITLPCGFDERGLPIGFQLVGRHLEEDVLCRAGHAFQCATDWHTRHPDV